MSVTDVVRINFFICYTQPKVKSIPNFNYSRNGYSPKVLLLFTGKHRRCDTTAFVGSTPETFKGLGLSQHLLPFVPKEDAYMDSITNS